MGFLPTGSCISQPTGKASRLLNADTSGQSLNAVGCIASLLPESKPANAIMSVLAATISLVPRRTLRLCPNSTWEYTSRADQTAESDQKLQNRLRYFVARSIDFTIKVAARH